MHKQLGAIMLVAGTCIGSGMIALPMTLAKLGIVPGILLMAALWSVIYYTCLVNLELNLQAGKGMALGALGQKFSGKIAGVIGTGSYMILSFALLSGYLYGVSSVTQKMLSFDSSSVLEFTNIVSIYAFVLIIIFLLPIKYIDYVNRLLFTGLIAVIAVLVVSLLSMINWDNLPLFSSQYQEISIWRIIIPIAFTCFGFQVIFHTLTNYCNKDPIMLKRTFFWGSLIPALVYIIWTVSILGAIYQNHSNFYLQMLSGDVDIGDLVEALSYIAKDPFIQILVWWLSVLAIITSVLGVGLALFETIREILLKKINRGKKIYAAIIAIMPAYLVTILIPNAFLAALGFAGMILVVIAILLPIYLLYKIKDKKFNYSELTYKSLVGLSALAGFGIMLCQILNMIV